MQSLNKIHAWAQMKVPLCYFTNAFTLSPLDGVFSQIFLNNIKK